MITITVKTASGMSHYLPGHAQFGNLATRHALCALSNLRTLLPVVELSQLQPPATQRQRHLNKQV